MTPAKQARKKKCNVDHANPNAQNTSRRVLENKNHTQDEKTTQAAQQSTILWTNLCISTGLNVRNRVNLTLSISYPVYVRQRYRSCAAACKPCKPLSMWTKNRLSTNFQPFTITTTFIYLSKLTKRAKQAKSGARPSSLGARLFLSTENR